jgi:methyl-accepting chemotaxis protein
MAEIKGKSMKVKIVFWVGLSMLLTFGIIIAYAATAQRRVAIETAKKSIMADAEAISNFMKAQIEVPMDAARTMAQALGSVGMEGPGDVKGLTKGDALTRDQVNRMFFALTEKNPQFIGTYTLWEPNAFDGGDSAYKGKFPYDHTGRFIAYWNRGDAGKIKVETPEDYEVQGAGDFYQLPKNRKKECLIEPYLYPVQGREVLMTSMVAPVMIRGEFRGIVGVDVSLARLQAYLKTHNPYPGLATVSLITYSGVIAASNGFESDIGAHMKKIHADWQEDITYVQNGKAVIELDEGRVAAFAPVIVGQTQTPWSININLPLHVLTGQATRLMWRMIIIGVVFTALAVLLLWMVAVRISKPIGEVTQAAQKISAGDLNVTAHVSATDESGLLADAFNGMVKNLKQMNQEVAERAEADRSAREYLETTVRNYVQFVETVGGVTSRPALQFRNGKMSSEYWENI